MKNQYAWLTANGFRKVFVTLIVVVSVLPSWAQTPLNEQEVYNRLISRKTQEGYTEGTPWDNSHLYKNKVTFDGIPAGYYTGGGCFGFMMDMMEYASNYEYPIRIIEGTYDNLPVIRVGDGVRLNNDGHSVVVLEKISDHKVIVAEANYGGKVHWGREIDLAAEYNGFTNIATFWPEVSNTIATSITDLDNDSLIREVRIYSLNGTQIKHIQQTGLSIKTVLSELPKGFYLVKEATKTYKVYNGE